VAVAGAYARLMAGDLIALLLVDDHAMVRTGLTRLLEGYADIELLGAVGRARHLTKRFS
jgi:DNA-binding NarL/FixJ family response regulator